MLLAIDFRVTAAAAAAVFAILTAAQLFALPPHRADPAPAEVSILDDWRSVVSNRSFLLFAAAMIGSYVLSFQVYLALPMQAAILSPRHQSSLVAAIFVLSALVAVAGQMRITNWFAAQWGPGRSLAVGLTVLAAAFVPLTLVPDSGRFGTVAAVAALLGSAVMLAIGSAAVFPFEMDTVMRLAGGRLLATHYGFYNTVIGVGILLGNLATGAIMGAARQAGMGALVWAGLTLVGIFAALGLHRLDAGDLLRPQSTTATPEDEPVAR